MDLISCKREVIRKGFPELKRVSVETVYTEMPDAFLLAERYSRKKYVVRVDTSLQGIEREVIIGGMSHEMGHISRWTVMDDSSVLLDSKKYRRYPTYRTLDERDADLTAIERGFGEELLAFLIYANKHCKRYNSKDGLSVKEIEKILKSRKLRSRNMN